MPTSAMLWVQALSTSFRPPSKNFSAPTADTIESAGFSSKAYVILVQASQIIQGAANLLHSWYAILYDIFSLEHVQSRIDGYLQSGQICGC